MADAHHSSHVCVLYFICVQHNCLYGNFFYIHHDCVYGCAVSFILLLHPLQHRNSTMASRLYVYAHNDDIYTSRTAAFFPEKVPRLAHWDPRMDHDWSPEDTEVPLTTCWAFGSRVWLPLVPTNPRYEGPIFECLNHTRYSLRTEHVGGGLHILHHDIRKKWEELEEKLLWCHQLLGAEWYVPMSHRPPLPPSSYGYKASHADASLTRKVAIRSRNAFLRKSMHDRVSIASWLKYLQYLPRFVHTLS